ncbi:chromate transporter, CHR family [Leptospira inadai serovar Lyme str. 10]|uniref:Chromate transporter, CHR family n=2 Tax=Leptospira inadai serovar Lyme TaxID=293084 RepID=V6HGW7_9LEPT|nr:chromate transporter [Leptospira inadai]EQA35020.1 chromate transporter, CHR family [Leptospira inadai serovar Lyme str. 10]PNV73983.1 ChrA protein [Leptospira inadai serovar Lyme]
MSVNNRDGDLRKIFDIFLVSLKLGLTSFGGPIAHIGYFHREYVAVKKWLDEKSYTDLVALCQFLPGPASSQLGIAIGTIRAGIGGGIAAWLGFTAPSAIALTCFAFLLVHYDFENAIWIHGLKVVAVSVVAQAIFLMWKKLITSWNHILIALSAAVVLSFWQTALSQIVLILAAGFLGRFLFTESKAEVVQTVPVNVKRSLAILCLVGFVCLLFLFPLLRHLTSSPWVSLADSFYRSGSLVFGGGHVVLPLLEKELVPSGLVSEQTFLAGYGAAQAVPGPLFTFASYLGATIDGVRGALIATAAIFLPAFLLILGFLPFWNTIRKNTKMQGILAGINSAVVGILLAALYNPLWTSAIHSPSDFVVAVALFALLVFRNVPSWAIVLLGIAASYALKLDSLF